MKIGEALQRYQNYRQTLTERTKALTEQRDAAQKKAKLTGGSEYTEAAATLHNMTAKKRKKYDSLWDDDEERKTKYTDPSELADNAEVGLDIALPEIPEDMGETAVPEE